VKSVDLTPKSTTLLRSFEGYPFRIHPRPSGRGILRRRVKNVLAFDGTPCYHDFKFRSYDL